MRTKLGIIGLGSLGQQLATDLDDGGIEISLYEYPEAGLDSKVIRLVLSQPHRKWRAGEDLVDFVVSIATPRVIIITPEQQNLELVLAQLDAICTANDRVIGLNIQLNDDSIFKKIIFISTAWDQLKEQLNQI